MPWVKEILCLECTYPLNLVCSFATCGSYTSPSHVVFLHLCLLQGDELLLQLLESNLFSGYISEFCGSPRDRKADRQTGKLAHTEVNSEVTGHSSLKAFPTSFLS